MPEIIIPDFMKRREGILQKKCDLSLAMEEYCAKFGEDAIGRCSTWDFPGTDKELAQLYHDCVASGKEMEDYLGIAGDTGDDDL